MHRDFIKNESYTANNTTLIISVFKEEYSGRINIKAETTLPQITIRMDKIERKVGYPEKQLECNMEISAADDTEAAINRCIMELKTLIDRCTDGRLQGYAEILNNPIIINLTN